MGNIATLGAILKGQGGKNKTKRAIGGKQHKGGKNTQPLPLIDHCS